MLTNTDIGILSVPVWFTAALRLFSSAYETTCEHRGGRMQKEEGRGQGGGSWSDNGDIQWEF